MPRIAWFNRGVRAGRNLIGAVFVGALALVPLALLGGCGGGGDTTAAGPLSRVEFLKRATAICSSEEERKIKALEAGSKLGKNFLAGSQEELKKLVSGSILPLYRKMIDELAVLKPPVKEQGQWERIVGEYQRTLKVAEANPALQLKDDSFVAVNTAASKFGVKECTL